MHKCKTNFRKRISEIKVEILLMKKKIYIHCAESQFGENYITIVSVSDPFSITPNYEQKPIASHLILMLFRFLSCMRSSNFVMSQRDLYIYIYIYRGKPAKNA